MARINILDQRLYNQSISSPRFTKPEEIVRWMGAIQAQDYLGSLWAIGLRLKNVTEKKIERAIVNKKIVRSWPMRGTLHFVASEDLRWMLKLLTPRVIQRSAGLYKQAGLDKNVLSKCRKVVSAALRDGKQLTRNEIYGVLDHSGISTNDQRGLHILGHLAQDALICFGPRKGKQQTFVLLDEWIPPSQMPDRDQAIEKLAVNYFNSHGPATVNDFAWWTGFTLTEAKNAVGMIKSQLAQEMINGVPYWMSHETKRYPSSQNFFLLPNFDEYLVAYKDRSAAIDPKFSEKIKASGNGIFTSPVISGGRITGTWKRVFEKEGVAITVNLFAPQNKASKLAADIAIREFGKFIDMPVITKSK